MKFKRIFLTSPIAVLMLLSSGFSAREACTTDLSLGYIQQTDLIVIAVLESKNAQDECTFVANVSKVFKGHAGSQILVSAVDFDFTFYTQTEYLIYGQQNNSGAYSITKCSRTQNVQAAADDIKFLMANIDCIDPALITNVICHRNLDPVCGCDGKTYGNPCEARKKGISVYTKGRCEKVSK